MSDRKRVNDAMRALRCKGVFAEGPLLCCQTCGWNAVETALAASGRRDATVVFWHDQSDQGAFTTPNGRRGDRLTAPLYLYWRGDKDVIADGLLLSGFFVDVPEDDGRAFVLWKEGTR